MTLRQLITARVAEFGYNIETPYGDIPDWREWLGIEQSDEPEVRLLYRDDRGNEVWTDGAAVYRTGGDIIEKVQILDEYLAHVRAMQSGTEHEDLGDEELLALIEAGEIEGL
jgi:hypothetical protein